MGKYKCFAVNTRNGIHYMTAFEIHNRIMNDSSNSNYNWLTSASELVRICNMNGFPEDYAKDIEIAILNCFASLELDVERSTEVNDQKAINVIFNQFSKTEDLDKQKARKTFLNVIISKAERWAFEIPIYFGKQYSEIEAKWRTQKLSEFMNKDNVDLYELFKLWTEEFRTLITQADKDGLLEEDKQASSKIFEDSVKIMMKQLLPNNDNRQKKTT